MKTCKTSMSHSITGSIKMQCFPRKFCYSKNQIVHVCDYYFMCDFLHNIHSA